MSAELLARLQEAHAFDPFPIREDLGVYHVPFSQLVDAATHIEQTLLDACRRFERAAVVGDSGTGKSSLTASVLGPLVEGVAPILIPVAAEPDEIVTEPRAMFAHIAAEIARFATDATALSSDDRESALGRLTMQRPIGRVGRNLRLGAGWMGATVSADLSKQAGPSRSIERSASGTLEVVHQMLATIHNHDLVPILVFDDTDRWLSGSALTAHEALARSFFGRVLPALVGLRCSLVVAVHPHYLADDAIRGNIERALEIRIDVPTLTTPHAIGEIVHSRVQAHLPAGAGEQLADVMTDDAVTRLFKLYHGGLRGELRGVLRTAHVALTDACDIGAEVITGRLIQAAFATWDAT